MATTDRGKWSIITCHTRKHSKDGGEKQTSLTDKKTRANSHLISVPEYPIMFAFEN